MSGSAAQLAARLMGVDTADALQAAGEIVKAAVNGSPVTPGDPFLGARTSVDGTALAVSFGQSELGPKASFTLGAVRELAVQGDTLAISVLRRAFMPEETSAEGAPPGSSRMPLTQVPQVASRLGNTVATARDGEVTRKLTEGADVSLIGPSSSGKTVTALHVARSLGLEGWSATWLDLSDPNVGAIDVLLTLARLRQEASTPHLLVVDNAQCDPRELSRLGRTVARIRQCVGNRLRVMAIGWGSVAPTLYESFPSSLSVPCRPDEVIDRLLSNRPDQKLPTSAADQIRTLASGDVLIASLALDYFAVNGRVPTLGQLAESTFTHLVSGVPLEPEARRVLYTIACLGQFEIDTAARYAREVSDTGVTRLVRNRIIRPNGDYFSLGHRSLAYMITTHLRTTDRVTCTDPPERLAYRYLAQAGERQTVAMLDRLDLSAVVSPGEDSRGTTFLARAWLYRKTLLNYLEALSRKLDPPWGDNLASAVFAGQAFASASHSAWVRTADFVRSRYDVPSSGPLPVPRGPPTVDWNDFLEIRKEMEREEAIVGPEIAPGERAAQLDMDRMMRTWVLGLLLGFEGTALKPDPSRIRRLKEMAAESQEPLGNFYPARVPWITARVLIGLSLAGEGLESKVVRDACEWLRTEHPTGARRQVWESGTGRWNTNVETTAMCVNALVRAGVPSTDPVVRIGSAYLLSTREKWTAPGREMDCAFTLETLSLVGAQGLDIGRDVASLLIWAVGREAWESARLDASATHEQGSKIPFIATYLVNIVLATVQSQLPTLLEGLQIRAQLGDGSSYPGDWRLLATIIGECLQEINRQVLEQIDSRRIPGGIAGPKIAEHRKEWEIRQDNLRALASDFEGFRGSLVALPPSVADVDAIVRRVDSLGSECFPGTWRSIAARSGGKDAGR